MGYRLSGTSSGVQGYNEVVRRAFFSTESDASPIVYAYVGDTIALAFQSAQDVQAFIESFTLHVLPLRDQLPAEAE